MTVEPTEDLADFIRDQVCCPRIHGCELHCYPDQCPAERVRALSDENKRLRASHKAAVQLVGQYAREAGLAKGRLEMSEAAGIVDGWRERAEAAEARAERAETKLKEAGIAP